MTRLADVPRAVIMQPTTLCQPLDCTYCYLPFRKTKHLMPVSVAQAVADPVNRWAEDDPQFELVWHGGEPLATGREYLAALMDPFRGVKHTLQTNAVLLDDAWCTFLLERDIGVGVSIDGPEDMNTHRVTRAGRPAYRLIKRGIDRLRHHGIPFSAIAVVSRPAPARAADLLDYTAFAKVRVTGPLAFSKCALSEASFTDCDLTDAVFSDCTLQLTEFGRGRYQGLDLRGNDLSAVRGVHRLAKVVIDRAQQAYMAEALLAELDVTYGDDLEEG